MAGMIAPLSERYCVAEASPPARPVAHEPEQDHRRPALTIATDEAEDVFVFPATTAQRRFWLLDQLVPGGNAALNMPLAVRLTGRLDREALTRSLQEIVRRHEVLRTTFHCERGQLRQLIAPSQAVPLPLVDVRDFPAQEQAGLPEHLVAEEAQRPFDLRLGPVIRGQLVRVSDEEHLLVLTLHHIVSDGWSNGVLLREMGELYAAFVRGQPSPLLELPIQFADYCQWQQEHAADGGSANQMPYWRQMLAGELPVLDLPTDRPRRPARGLAPRGGFRQEMLPAPLVQALKALGVRAGVSPYMLFLAAFTVLLSRYSGGQEDILLNTPSANRDRREVEPLIGPFVNPLLLRLDLSGNPTFGDFLRRVRKVVLGAFEHADVPFEKLIEEIPPRRLQTNFLYQSNFLRPARLPDLDLVPLTINSGAILAEWSAAVVEDGAGAYFSIAYNADLFDAATIDRALASYERLLVAIAAPAGVETVVSRLPLERAQPTSPGSALLADRWRLPAATVAWLDGCGERNAAAGKAELAQPRSGIEFLVLDRHLQPPPTGVVGEIYLRGLGDAAAASAGLANLRRIEASPTERLLKTGDRARRLADGRIEWIGRAEQEISVHGLRVDTGVIETALRAHPHVREAVVLWRERSGERQLTAFVQGDGAVQAELRPRKMRDFLRETLPEEFIPAAYVPVEFFPLSSTGLLNAAALPAGDIPAEAEEKSETPYLTIHHQLIDLWQELLGVPAIGIGDDFFALGGNSLLAMRMLYRIEQIFGRALLPVTLFKQPTIEHLADEILKSDPGQTTAALVRINDQGSKTPIFFLHGDFHGGGFYAMKLARHLGTEQPFYALPPAELTDPSMPPTIAQMAAQQIERLREVRPHGPYVIGGFCLGGLIAYEAAQQLEAAGETVERLLIIDATLKNRRLQALRQAAELFGRWRGLSADRQLYLFCRWHFLLARLERWGRMPLAEQTEVVSRRLQTGCQRIGRWFRSFSRPPTAGNVPLAVSKTAPADSDWFDPRWDVPLVYLWSAGGYTPQPYAGPTTVLLSRDLFRGWQLGGRSIWKMYLRMVDVRELPGSHLACITEHVDTLAETIACCLEPTPVTAAPERLLATVA